MGVGRGRALKVATAGLTRTRVAGQQSSKASGESGREEMLYTCRSGLRKVR